MIYSHFESNLDFGFTQAGEIKCTDLMISRDMICHSTQTNNHSSIQHSPIHHSANHPALNGSGQINLLVGQVVGKNFFYISIHPSIRPALIHESCTVIQAPKLLCQFMAEDIPPPVLNKLVIRYLVNLLVRIKEPSSPTGWQPQTEDTKKSRKL